MAERRRKFGGWGYEDQQPPAAEVEQAGRAARDHLGFGPAEVEQPPRLEDVRLPPSRIEPPASLAAICRSDPYERASHSYGKAYRDLVRAFRGRFDHPPDVVAHPRDERELEQLLGWCADEGVAAIPFGGGTSVVGGVEPRVPHEAVVTIDLKRMNRVLDVDPVSRAARTRAGGHYATLHTHIDDFVESIRAITPSGAWESRRLPGSGAGPSPDRMLIGSEGTLGVITEAWMRVQDRPRWKASAGVLLDEREGALTMAAPDGQALLVLGFESADHPVDAWLERALELAHDHGGDAREPKAG